MIVPILNLSLCTACAGGTIRFAEDPERGGVVRGVIDGEEFVMRQGSTMQLHRGHYRIAMFMLDTQTDECSYMPENFGYLRADVTLPLEIGSWSVGDPELDVGRLDRIDREQPFSAKISEGWIEIDEIYDPNYDRQSWVSGALELRTRDGSWVAGRFEEVTLCYFEP